VRAGDEDRAWEDLAADLRVHYQTIDGIELLRKETGELLRE